MPESASKQFIIAFVPVIHRGYLELFKSYGDVRELYLINPKTIAVDSVDYLRKDLRQLEPVEAANALKGLKLFSRVDVFSKDIQKKLDKHGNKIVMPDEDISRLIGAAFKRAAVTYHGVFLRWDRRNLAHINARSKDKMKPTTHIKHVAYMKQALQAASVSTDIWRRVGAVLVAKNDKLVGESANTGEPSQLSPWLEGDPRNIFSRGVGIEMSVFSHAEALLIARAAKHGLSLEQARIYVTEFPCPACAKLIANSGISHLYYREGYAVLDGKRVLEEHGVKVQRVIAPEIEDLQPEIWVPYKKP